MAKQLRVRVYNEYKSPILETTVARVVWHNSSEKLWDVMLEEVPGIKVFVCDEPCLYIFPANVSAVEIRPVDEG